MVNPSTANTIFTEIFPIITSKLPALTAYKLIISGSDENTIGGKLAYQLKNRMKGHCAWTQSQKIIVADVSYSMEELKKTIHTLWEEQPNPYASLLDIIRYDSEPLTNQSIADFVAFGLLAEQGKELKKVLDTLKIPKGNLIVERVYNLRGWVVQGQPAVSLTLKSELAIKQSLREYMKERPFDEIRGLRVGPVDGSFTGEIEKEVGPISAHRQRLLAFKPKEAIQEAIQDAADDELVVTISTGRNTYDYPISALRITPSYDQLACFGIKVKTAQEEARIAPQKRAGLIKKLADVIKSSGYVEAALTSTHNPHVFRTFTPSIKIQFGDETSFIFNEKTIFNDLIKHKLYCTPANFQNNKGLRVGFLVAPSLEASVCSLFWDEIAIKLRLFQLPVEKIARQLKDLRQSSFEREIHELQSRNVDLIVAFLPDDYVDEDDDESAYNHFKSLSIGLGIPCQVIEQSSIDNQKGRSSIIQNLVMGILAKTGHIPYIFADSLSFADLVVGIDVGRDAKKRLAGSINTTAITRIYTSRGEFLSYELYSATLEGETLPARVLKAMFPASKFQNKRVVIHRDGLFRGQEKEILIKLATEINATFYLVEVIKSGAPRIYQLIGKDIHQPQKGSAVLLSSQEALLISSLPPFPNATPRPLHIKAEAPLTIEQALQSVLMMTNLHYGSVKSPRLPVTIHYADKIAGMANDGIKPKDSEGNIPYWL